MSNKYVVLSNNIVQYTFEEFEEFRQKPATELYSAEFLAGCLLVTDETVTDPGDIYDPETNSFSAPIVVPPVEDGEVVN